MDLLYAIAGHVSRFMEAGPGLIPALVCLTITAIPVTLLHELGHALVARGRLGADVEVSVGNTGRIAQLQLGQIAIAINALARPDAPAGATVIDDARATARDVLLIALAGPAASLGGVLASAWALSAAAPTGVVHDLLWAATLGGVGGVLNIVPLTLQERRGGPALRTDGRLALDALRVATAATRAGA